MTKILIVDDEKEVVEMLNFILEKEGFEIISASTGQEAMEKVGILPSSQVPIKPDLVILDIMMPEIDGYTVQNKMMENPATSSIPIIILTAKGQMRELFGMASNVSAYIDKPFDPQILKDKILGVLNKK